jgi:hypothetical protein
MEILILIIVALIYLLFPVRYKITIFHTPDDESTLRPAQKTKVDSSPSPTPDDEPLTVSPEYLHTLNGATQAQLFRIVTKSHLELIEQAIRNRQPAKARQIIASLKAQFPDAKIDGLETAERMIHAMETGKA